MNFHEPSVAEPAELADTEAQRLIEFAALWAPFGGARDEDILVNFGMTAERFAERLWQVITEINCGSVDLNALMRAYPDRSPTDNRTAQTPFTEFSS